MPTCIKCSLNKKQSLFFFHKTKKRYENRCLACKRSYTLEKNRLIRARNVAFIRSIKENSPCKDCGQKWHFCQLDFDHIDVKTKKYEIWRVTTQSIASIQAEIAKCDIVCANCHRERTQKVFGQVKLNALPQNHRYSEFINSLKSKKKCCDCRFDFPHYMLDYDHIQAKSFELNRAKQLRTDKGRVLEEINKCELICVNCHRLRTFRRSKQISISEVSSSFGILEPQLLEIPTVQILPSVVGLDNKMSSS